MQHLANPVFLGNNYLKHDVFVHHLLTCSADCTVILLPMGHVAGICSLWLDMNFLVEVRVLKNFSFKSRSECRTVFVSCDFLFYKMSSVWNYLLSVFHFGHSLLFLYLPSVL